MSTNSNCPPLQAQQDQLSGFTHGIFHQMSSPLSMYEDDSSNSQITYHLYHAAGKERLLVGEYHRFGFRINISELYSTTLNTQVKVVETESVVTRSKNGQQFAAKLKQSATNQPHM